MKIKKRKDLIDAKLCSRCGLPQWEWDPVWENEGYILHGKAYCCKGCAHGLACTCLNSEAEGDDPGGRNTPRAWR